MNGEDFPALYRSADQLSLNSQKHFFLALGGHLTLLVVAATLSVLNFPLWQIPALQLLVMLGALSCSIYLLSKRPDRYWYAARAVAESIKTITWRYVCRAEPFSADDATSKNEFHQKLRAIVEQNRDVSGQLTDHLGLPQITTTMATLRAQPLDKRRAVYLSDRIVDQLDWYARKARFNRRQSSLFFWVLVAANSVAVVLSAIRIPFAGTNYWPTDIFIAIAASLLTWMQAKRFSELATAYSLAAHEIGFVRMQISEADTDLEFSAFVGDAENAFSREHTQWIARQDT